MAGLAEQWFRIADEDKDGKISGGEAVRFFTRSGLPKDVLGQIWDLASGGGPALNQMQFNTSMRLVALAQVSMGRLIPDQARAVAMGGGPQLPLPRMAGLDGAAPPPAPGAPGGYTLQVTGAPPPAAAYSPQVTGGAPPMGYAPQVTGGAPYAPQITGPRPVGPAGYSPQVTGGGPPRPGVYTPQMTGASGYGPQATGGAAAPPIPGYGAPPRPPAPGAVGYAPQVTGGWPPVSAEDMSRYRAQFSQLDRDGDGLVQGSDCFGVFMQTGLDKRVLKQIWDAVAGASGSLNAEQFVRAVYLMDQAKRGAPPPPALPPGQFPPLAAGVAMPPVPAAAAGPTGGGAAAGPTGGAAYAGHTGGFAPAPAPAPQQWSLASQFGEKSATKAVAEVYDQTLPRLPGMPGKVAYDPKAALGRDPRASEVPALDDEVLKMLGPSDKERFESARGEASKKEDELLKAEAEAEAAKQRLKVFQEALAEVMLFRSRADVALLTATDQASRLAAEAEETERRYHAAYLAAQGQFAASEEARKELQAALAKKQEAANRLQLLQQEIAMLNNMTPQEMAALQAEVAGLVAQVSAAESKKASLELVLDAGRKQRSLLGARAQDLELSAAAGEAELGRVRAELATLLARVDELASAPAAAAGADGRGGRGDGKDLEVGDLCDMLVKAAAAYRSLFSAVQGRGADVPYAALLNNVGALVWVDTILAGAADWMDADAPLPEAPEEGEPAGPPGPAGYSVVNALPELEGVPPALLRATAAAATLLKPMKRAPGAAASAGGAGAAAGEAAAEGAAAEGVPAEGAAGADAKGEAAAAAVPEKAAASPKKAAAAGGAAAAAAAAAAGAGAVSAIAAAVATADAPEPPAKPEAAAAAVAEAKPETGFEDAAFGGAPSAAAAAAPEPPAAPAAAAAAAAAAPAPAASLSFDEGDAFTGGAPVGGAAAAAFERQDSAVEGQDLTNPFAHFAPGQFAAQFGGPQATFTGQSATTDSSGFEDSAF